MNIKNLLDKFNSTKIDLANKLTSNLSNISGIKTIQNIEERIQLCDIETQ